MRMVFSLAVAGLTVVALTSSALAAGDAEKGKAAFAKCGICHQVGPGAKTLVGPELNGIVGRKAASVADYAMYSAGMKKLGADGWVWTEERSVSCPSGSHCCVTPRLHQSVSAMFSVAIQGLPSPGG